MSMSLSGNDQDQAAADSGVVLRAGREHVITLLAHRAVLRNCLNDSSLFPEVCSTEKCFVLLYAMI